MADRAIVEIPTPILGALIEALIAELDQRAGDVDLEDDHDAERETWSNPEDCPSELFLGRRI